MKSDLVYLKQILNAINLIGTWSEDSTLEDFLDDRSLFQSAVIKQLEVIGEVSAKLGDGLKQKYNDIPWKKIIGMRNRLIHEYLTVDLDLAWGVVENELPVLRRRIEEITLLEENNQGN